MRWLMMAKLVVELLMILKERGLISSIDRSDIVDMIDAQVMSEMKEELKKDAIKEQENVKRN